MDKNTVSQGWASAELGPQYYETVWDHLGSYLRWKTQLDDNNWLRSSGTLSCSQDRQAAAGHHKDIMVVTLCNTRG